MAATLTIRGLFAIPHHEYSSSELFNEWRENIAAIVPSFDSSSSCPTSDTLNYWSGFIYDRRGRVITCSHVFSFPEPGQLCWILRPSHPDVREASTVYKYRVVYHNPQEDHAILSPEGKAPRISRVPRLGGMETMHPGDGVWMAAVYANRFRNPSEFQWRSITLDTQTLFRQASLNVWGCRDLVIPGMSGGAVFSKSTGELVGLIHGVTSRCWDIPEAPIIIQTPNGLTERLPLQFQQFHNSRVTSLSASTRNAMKNPGAGSKRPDLERSSDE